ncbi:MAG: M56 family metallopeptidase, partial [Verrucomicrobiia bacterium]
ARTLARVVAADCGLANGIEMRRGPACRVPMAWGVWRPVVLLPDTALAWPEQRLAATLRHEFGHVRRRDCLARLLAQVACAVYWMNPLVWMAARRLRVAQEQACDDLVLSSGASASDYANLIVQTVRGLDGHRLSTGHALAMAQPSTLEARVRAIVDEQRNRAPLGRGALAVGMAAAVALVAASALAQVQDKPDPNEPKQQIMVEAKIIELPASQASAFLPDKNGKATLSNPAETQEIVKKISAMKEADILCAPRVTTFSGQRARVEVGRELRIGKDGSKTVFDGITLDVLPKVQKNGLILLSSTLTIRQLLSDAKEPFTEQSFRERNITTTVTRASGHTLAAGGVQNDAKGRALLLLLTASLVNDAGGKLSPPAKPGTAEEKARRIMVPRLEFQEASLATVVDFLEDASRAFDPEKKGVNIILQMPPGAKPPAITLNLREVPLFDAVRYTAEVAGLTMVADENALVLSPAKAPAAGTPRLAAPVGAAAEKAKRIVVPRMEFAEAPLSSVVEYLKDASCTLDPEKKGVNIILRIPPGAKSPAITLNLREVPLLDAVRYTAEVAGLKMTADENALVLSPAKVPAAGTPRPAAPVGTAAAKAKRIVVPKIEFREASLADVVEYLRDASCTLDSEKKGINIILQIPPGVKPPAITLSLRNIPLLDVLSYVADIGGLNLVADDHALRLMPKKTK